MSVNFFSIIINTTDSYEDCWIPFFTLFRKYWPEYRGKIYLNTESKFFSFPDLNIVPVRNSQYMAEETPTWSNCLQKALNIMEEKVILYMQEDYFIKSKVNYGVIEELSGMMIHNEIDCIHLTDQNSEGPFSMSNFEDLWLIDRFAPYRVSCQAALWNRSVLIQYLRKHESPWQFEKFGTKRSQILNHNFYSVNRNVYKLNINEIIPYVFTGIIRGYWIDEVVHIFNNNGIYVDYNIRGFLRDAPPRSIFSKIKRRIGNLNPEIRSKIDYFLLYLKNG